MLYTFTFTKERGICENLWRGSFWGVILVSTIILLLKLLDQWQALIVYEGCVWLTIPHSSCTCWLLKVSATCIVTSLKDRLRVVYATTQWNCTIHCHTITSYEGGYFFIGAHNCQFSAAWLPIAKASIPLLYSWIAIQWLYGCYIYRRCGHLMCLFHLQNTAGLLMNLTWHSITEIGESKKNWSLHSIDVSMG